MFPLGLLTKGERAEVVEFSCREKHTELHSQHHHYHHSHHHHHDEKDHHCHSSSRLEEMGIRPGKVIEMISNEGKGPLIIKFDNSRIALCRKLAMKVKVRRVG